LGAAHRQAKFQGAMIACRLRFVTKCFPQESFFSHKNIICIKDCKNGPVTFLISMTLLDIHQ